MRKFNLWLGVVLWMSANFAHADNVAQFVRTDYTGTPVTTAAYVQLVSSLAKPVLRIVIFDSSGKTLKIAIGAPGQEVDQFLIPPGGGDFAVKFSAQTRISIRAVSGNATTGENDINFFY